MGRWFVQFLSSQGFGVEVADPHGGPDGVPRVADWRTTDLKHDYIVLATPARRDRCDPARPGAAPAARA